MATAMGRAHTWGMKICDFTAALAVLRLSLRWAQATTLARLA
jgi:hypothetical protein